MDNSYNPEKLAEAIKAFGKERLEELQREYNGRLAYMEIDTLMLCNPPKKVYTYYLVLPNNYVGNLVAIHTSITFECVRESDITYLEPPRPLRKEGNGHTKEEMEKAFCNVLDPNFESWYTSTFPTATAPTEEQIDTSAIEFPSDDSLLATGQPEPSFTREEMERLIRDLRYLTADRFMGSREVHKLRGVILNKLGWELCQPRPSRLDLLIKWWGEQERPSEITFTHEESIEKHGGVATKSPQSYHTHYRRGTSEWISLEGVV